MARVLVVDDSAFMRNTLKYLFERAGHEVVGLATGGREAVDLFAKLEPDLVTLDVLMDDMDGIEALRLIRQMDPEAKVMMVTVQHQENLQQEARKLGASGYIKKPFKEEEMVQAVERVLGKNKGEK